MREGNALSFSKGWKEIRLDKIANITMGLSPNGLTYNSSSIGKPLLNGPTEFGETYPNCTVYTTDSKRVCKKGDLIFCVRGSTTGRMNWADKEYSLGRGVCSISGKTRVDTIFIKHYLSLNLDKLLKITGGGTFPNLRTEDIKGFEIKLPNNYEKIANILTGYDDLIENNQKRIKILEEMAQQTYEEWFVRMRFPGYETAIFDENDLPEGWEKVKCFDAMEVLSGGTPKTNIAEYWNGGIEFFTPKDAKSGSYTNGTEKTVTELGVRKCNSKLYPKDTVFITARGTVGKLNLASKPMIMNQSCYALKGKNGITQFFLFCAMKAIIETFKSASNGGVFNTIIVDTFKFLDFVIPESALISKFENIVKPIFNSILNLQSQNQRLREARDILLPRLMMGMIDVSRSLVQMESVEAKPTNAKVIPLEQPKKEASKEFKEAVLIACITERFGSEKFPLGRKRYTKLSYLFHRYSDNKIQDYLRKAAGPYNPKTKYGGPEKIALNNKYIQNWKSDNKLTGFVTAEKIEDAKTYFANYWQIADLDWLTIEFKFKSNDELELLATVDNSLVELSKKNVEFTAANVLGIIKSEKEWEAKLERTIFSDANVERAIGFLRRVLEYGNN